MGERVSLFDGLTSDGWNDILGGPISWTAWSVEQGCLRAHGGCDGYQDIRTSAEFLAFELSFEWRIARGGNSGVKYLLTATDRWMAERGNGYHARARGLEYQILGGGDPDWRRISGALYEKFAPRVDAARPPGEWNQGRVVVDAHHLEHWLNGELVVRAELAEAGARLHPSPIALQNHDSDAWFRKLLLRPLDGAS